MGKHHKCCKCHQSHKCKRRRTHGCHGSSFTPITSAVPTSPILPIQSAVPISPIDSSDLEKASLVEYKVSTKAPIIDNNLNIPDSIWVTGATTFWTKGFEGNGVLIGVIDTGIDDTHPVLIGKVVRRRDYVKDGKPSISYNPHGTHVAGTLAANSTILKGVAPKASLADYRVLDVNGSGSFVNVTRAVIDATNDGCHIINMSLGSSSPYAPLQKAIQYALSKNVLVVVAAGNEGAGKVSYPGGYPEVVSVGAVHFDSALGSIVIPVTPWFSNTNPNVDVCSDGWKILSCIPGNKYAYYSGTSMSAPCVSGFAALTRCKLIAKMQRSPTEAELYAVLRSDTIEIASLLPKNPYLQGSGFVTVLPEIPQKVNGIWNLPLNY